MKRIIFLVALFAVGCEEQRISTCGFACIQSGLVMQSYSNVDGCKCANPICSDAGVR